MLGDEHLGSTSYLRASYVIDVSARKVVASGGKVEGKVGDQSRDEDCGTVARLG